MITRAVEKIKKFPFACDPVACYLGASVSLRSLQATWPNNMDVKAAILWSNSYTPDTSLLLNPKVTAQPSSYLTKKQHVIQLIAPSFWKHLLQLPALHTLPLTPGCFFLGPYLSPDPKTLEHPRTQFLHLLFSPSMLTPRCCSQAVSLH